ncbi:MAG: DNA-directed RNA polymerase subunit omega [Spirochaetales bacterium]|nr:DNA-directed RNA polymerase subunit omega [Spirochaetales bacterium]
MSSKKEYTVPLRDMVDSEQNVYELTNAAIRRAEQLSLTKMEEMAKNKAKVSSAAIREVVTKEVGYSYNK